jgi:hypothetical protein
MPKAGGRVFRLSGRGVVLAFRNTPVIGKLSSSLTSVQQIASVTIQPQTVLSHCVSI